MPLWVGLYLLGILGLNVANIWFKIHARLPHTYILLDAMNSLLLLLTGAAYWTPVLAQNFASVAFVAFILGIAWLPVAIRTELALDILKNPDLSPTGNTVVLICGLVLSLALVSPLYYWGFLYAVQGQNAPPF